VLEPAARNSAAAIAAAAVIVGETAPDAVLWIMAADAAVKDVPALRRALEAAAAAARGGRIATFGIRPTSPETGYGYIEQGGELTGADGARAVARFVEKPDAATASASWPAAAPLEQRHVRRHRATCSAELEAHAPAVLAAARAGGGGRGAGPRLRPARRGVPGRALHLDRPCGDGAHGSLPPWCPATRAGRCRLLGVAVGDRGRRTRRATRRSGRWRRSARATATSGRRAS
jgi:hypothetical protein